MKQNEVLNKQQEIQKRLEYLESQINKWPEWKKICGSYIFDSEKDKQLEEIKV